MPPIDLITTEERRQQFKTALPWWATERGISPADFAEQLDYTYNHAYQLLRGDRPVTDATIGRFVLCYGVEAYGEVLERMRLGESVAQPAQE